MNDLAAKIRHWREALNYTQEYVAEKLGISVKTYRRLEAKDSDSARLLTLERLIKLAQILRVPPDLFLSPLGAA